MLSLEMERDHLAKANRDIAQGEGRLAAQAELIERMRNGGQSVEDAEALLDTMERTLQAWREHRVEILRTIARLEEQEHARR